MVQPPGQSYLRDIIIKREGGGGSGEWRVEEAGRRQREEEGGRRGEREAGNSLQVKLNAEYEVLGGYLVDRAPTGRTPRLNHVTMSEEPPLRSLASSLQPPAQPPTFLFLPQTQRHIDLQSASTLLPPDHL